MCVCVCVCVCSFCVVLYTFYPALEIQSVFEYMLVLDKKKQKQTNKEKDEEGEISEFDLISLPDQRFRVRPQRMCVT